MNLWLRITWSELFIINASYLKNIAGSPAWSVKISTDYKTRLNKGWTNLKIGKSDSYQTFIEILSCRCSRGEIFARAVVRHEHMLYGLIHRSHIGLFSIPISYRLWHIFSEQRPVWIWSRSQTFTSAPGINLLRFVPRTWPFMRVAILAGLVNRTTSVRSYIQARAIGCFY